MQYILLTSFLFLAACQGGPAPIDGKAFLSKLTGPAMPSVQDSLFKTAKEAEERRDYKQAIALYRQLLDKYPGDEKISIALGNSYRKKGEYDYAVIVFDDVLKKNDKHVDALEGKALALLSKGDFNTPVTLLEKVQEQAPNRWKTLNALGILFTTRGLQPEAQQYFYEALVHNPDSPTVLNNLGLSQALEKQFEKSIRTLSDASNAAPRLSYTRKRIDLNMALVYAAMGRLDDSRIVAGNYYSGAELENNMGIYAHIAKHDRLAEAYLNMALSSSKVFYEKAWDNLQAVNGADPVPQTKIIAPAPQQ